MKFFIMDFWVSENPRETWNQNMKTFSWPLSWKGEKQRGKGREAREMDTSEVCSNKAFKDFTVLLFLSFTVLLFDALFKTSQ